MTGSNIKTKKEHRIINTEQPTVFYEAPARLKKGYNDYAEGTVVLTSKSIHFTDDTHRKRFDIDLHAIDDLYFRRNGLSFEVTRHKKTYAVYPGEYQLRYRIYCAVGLVFGIVPGFLVYHFRIDPERQHNRTLTHKLQSIMSRHAIRIDD